MTKKSSRFPDKTCLNTRGENFATLFAAPPMHTAKVEKGDMTFYPSYQFTFVQPPAEEDRKRQKDVKGREAKEAMSQRSGLAIKWVAGDAHGLLPFSSLILRKATALTPTSLQHILLPT